MKKFNLSKFSSQNDFICTTCGKRVNYKSASQGCSSCGGSIFRLAQRGTDIPRAWQRQRGDKDQIDPYLRQKQKSYDGSNSENKQKLTTPAEDWGLGQRFRGREGPKGYSELDPDDRSGNPSPNRDLPTEETNIDQPPNPMYDLHSEFADPEDPLSRINNIHRKQVGLDDAGGKGSLDQQLATQRTKVNLSDDNIFEKIRNKQRKGVL